MQEELAQKAATLAEGLYPHQVEGLAFLLGRRRAILADDMGLGKTRQSIVALRESVPGPYLVVCPASVKNNWQREIHFVDPAAAVVVVGKAATPSAGFLGWVIVNYDLLRRERAALLALGAKGFVFDEAHYLKNHLTQRSRLSRELIRVEEGREMPVVHVLTGTPMTNRPRDLFPLLQLVDHSLGRSFLAFAKRYCDAKKNDYGYWITSGASRLDELTMQLQGVMLRRTKDAVLDLPSKHRTWIDVEVEQSIRDTLNETLSLFLDDSRRTRRGGRAAISLISSARRRLAVAKVKQTVEYVEGVVAQGEKVVLFSCFTHATRRFEKAFGDRAVAVTGEVPSARRQALIDRFQHDDSVRVFIGQIHAAGIGINLTAARVVVFNDLDWVPANHWQAEDRVHRIGQNAVVQVTYMVGQGTLEEFVRAVLETKANLVNAIVEGKVLEESMGEDVLAELKEMLAYVDAETAGVDDAHLEERVQAAGQAYVEAHGGPAKTPKLKISASAISALTAVLRGPKTSVFRVRSKSGKGSYRVEVDGADVSCECAGFSYRGTCRHVRDLKAALARGDPPPEEFERI